MCRGRPRAKVPRVSADDRPATRAAPLDLRDLDPSTLAVHAGEAPDPTTGALDAPIVLSNTFAFDDAADAAAQFAREKDGYIYARWRSPTVEVLERKIAALEGAEDTVATASGMAAVHGVFAAFCVQGDRVVAPRAVYAETARLLRETLPRFGIETTFVDTTDLGAVEAALSEGAKIVWLETPANPTLAVTDLAAVARLAHDAGALVAVDGTFATPWHQTPLAEGVDLVVHSATKGIGGHGDAVGGLASGRRGLTDAVRDTAVRRAGGAMAPLNAWLLARGAETLPLRAARAAESAAELARRLEADPRVARVSYPGLPSHPQHDVARRQMRNGFGALVAFEVRGGLDAGRRLHDGVRLVSRAVSLGDARTLITHPASTTHVSMPPEARAAAGLGDGLLRLSVGLEHVDDLWRDLDAALGSP